MDKPIYEGRVCRVELSKHQPENKNYINIDEIDGIMVGIIHKDKIIEVLKRKCGQKD